MTTVGTVQEIWRYPVKSMQGERLEATTLRALGVPGDRGWAIRDERAGEMRGAKQLPALLGCAATYRTGPADDTVGPVDITLPDGARTASDAADVGERLSALVGRPVTLWPRQPATDEAHHRRVAVPPERLERELRDLFAREPDEPLPDLAVFPPELLEFTSPLGTYFDAFPLHVVTTASLATLTGTGVPHRFDRRRFRPNVLVATAPGTSGLPEAEWGGRRLAIGDAELALTVPTPRCGMTTHAQPGLPGDPTVLRTIVREAAQNVGIYATVAVAGRIAVGDAVRLA